MFVIIASGTLEAYFCVSVSNLFLGDEHLCKSLRKIPIE